MSSVSAVVSVANLFDILNQTYARAVLEGVVEVVRTIATANQLDAELLLASVSIPDALQKVAIPPAPTPPVPVSATPHATPFVPVVAKKSHKKRVSPPLPRSSASTTPALQPVLDADGIVQFSTATSLPPSHSDPLPPAMVVGTTSVVIGTGTTKQKPILPFIPPREGVEYAGCHGIEFSFGLFTLCSSTAKPEGELRLCKRCTACKEKGTLCGTLSQRLATSLYAFKDSRNRSPKPYLAVLETKGYGAEDARRWASEKGVTIPVEHFTFTSEFVKRGRPKKNATDASTVTTSPSAQTPLQPIPFPSCTASATATDNDTEPIQIPQSPTALLQLASEPETAHAPAPAPAPEPARAPPIQVPQQLVPYAIDTIENGEDIKIKMYVDKMTNNAYFENEYAPDEAIGTVVFSKTGELEDIQFNKRFYARYPEDPYGSEVDTITGMSKEDKTNVVNTMLRKTPPPSADSAEDDDDDAEEDVDEESIISDITD